MAPFSPKFTATVAHLRAEIDGHSTVRIVRADNAAPVWDGKYQIVNGWVVFDMTTTAPVYDALAKGLTDARNAG